MSAGLRLLPVGLLALVLAGPGCKKSSSGSATGCTITSVLPVVGAAEGGTILTILGSGFESDPNLAVVVGANAVAGFWISDTEVRAQAPPDTRLPTGGPVDIKVISSSRRCQIPAAFTYIANCSITQVTPDTADAAGGELVRITGANFENDPSLTVDFGGATALATWISSVEIEVLTPSDTRLPPGGPVDVTVTSPNRSCTLPGGFTYIYAPVGAASVIINGSPLVFDTAQHAYDPGNGAFVIYMTDSTPVGWEAYIVLFGADSNPGCIDTCSNFMFLEFYGPSGEVYWENPCTYDGSACFSQYSTTPGAFTTGTFSGQIENIFVSGDILDLTNGQFSAERL